jgi:hypothetical protein
MDRGKAFAPDLKNLPTKDREGRNTRSFWVEGMDTCDGKVLLC